ncbi:MAG: hypothetical protein J4F41_10265 [Alphaproteobacteria bacterium]|nr:hypothetical protein [Alphaproteobacteria bacterium]
MKKIAIALPIIAMASFAQAQTGEVPALSDVLSGMSETEISTLEADVANDGSITGDIDVAIDGAIDDAITDGLITADQADMAREALTIVNANADFFNFDILAVIEDGLSNGDFTLEELNQTLSGFQSLSEEGKAIVAQESFSGDPSQPDFQSLSAEDQAIVTSAMPAVQP